MREGWGVILFVADCSYHNWKTLELDLTLFNCAGEAQSAPRPAKLQVQNTAGKSETSVSCYTSQGVQTRLKDKVGLH